MERQPKKPATLEPTEDGKYILVFHDPEEAERVWRLNHARERLKEKDGKNQGERPATGATTK